MQRKTDTTGSPSEHRRKAEDYRRLAGRVATQWVREALLAQAASHREKAMAGEDRALASVPGQLGLTTATSNG
jgi:hypothetical protein